MKIPEEKVSSLVSVFIAILLFIGSFFVIYANEIILDKTEQKSKVETKMFYEKFYFWNAIESISNYKNSVIQKNDDSTLVKWIIRLVWILWIGFAMSLFSIQIAKDKSKEDLVKKSFLFSAVWIIIFIILLKIYLFYLAWWFNIDLSFLTSKTVGTLSVSEKILIILLIIIAFAWLWYFYNYQQKKKWWDDNL